MEKTIAQKISALGAELKFEDLPEKAVSHAKMLTLDVLASMVGTRNIVTSAIARETAEELGGPEEGTIVGSPKKAALPNAAFANAIQCYGYDFVDDHNESNAHPSPATYPVSFALAEFYHRSGKEFIEAVALGNEVVCRMGTAYLGDMYYQGFHPTSTCGTMGAALSAGKLMKLDEEKLTDLQGIAGSMVAGLMAWNSPEFERRYPEHYSSAVEITMADGTKYEAVVDDPRGDWRNPVSYEDVKAKFRTLANRVYAHPQRTEAVIAFVDDLPNQTDMAELMALVNDAGK